ncbi:MAG: flagellar protein [Lachnospiraceae bacterium]|nr:flagellar protein [Lachnospiraceae bacterium]
MERINNYTSIDQITGQFFQQKNSEAVKDAKPSISFDEVLRNTKSSIEEVLDNARTGTLKFSKHAGNRLLERNIELSTEQLSRLEDGVSKAKAKGIKESLVIMDNYSFIVNTNNQTVITAMDQATEEENIYTNIDGAVII